MKRLLCLACGHRWTYHPFWQLLAETTGLATGWRRCRRCGRQEATA